MRFTMTRLLSTSLLICCYVSGEANAQDKIEAVVFGKDITTEHLKVTSVEISPGVTRRISWRNLDEDQYRYKVLSYFIFKEVNNQLDKQCEIEVSEDEVQSFLDYYADKRPGTESMISHSDSMKKQYDALSKEEKAEFEVSRKHGDKVRAKQQWLSFYRSKCLYEAYGGTVIFQQANPQEPVGAIRAHLEKLESEGNLIIYDPRYRERFWGYFKAEHSFVVSPEDVDYSKPWWEEEQKR